MFERLLRLVGPLHVIGGLLVFATGFVPEAQTFLASLFAKTDDFVWSPFFVAVLGPTIASWGVLFSAVVRQYLNTRSRPAWRTLLLSIVIWVPLDTLLCIRFGLWGGAMLNGVVVLVLAILLYAVRPSAAKR